MGAFTLSFPPVTRAVKWLILANAAIYLVQALLQGAAPDVYRQVMGWLALSPVAVVHGYVWQLLTYAFLHANLMHLLFNMWALWMFGSAIETAWGHREFLRLFFFSALGAGLVSVALAYSHAFGMDVRTPTVGASGGIFGVLVAFGMVFGETEVRMFPLVFISFKAKYFVAGMIFIAVASTLEARGDGVAYVAHVGGLIFGLLYTRFMSPRGYGGFYRRGVIGRGLSDRAYDLGEPRRPSWMAWQWARLEDSFYRWRRRRLARKFETYMRERDREVRFDDQGRYIEPEQKKDDDRWVN